MIREESAGKKAWSIIMGTVENSSEGAIFRFFLSIILITGICFSGYSFYVERQYNMPILITEPPRQDPVADRRRLEEMVRDLNAANAARTNSMEVASEIASMARYPFVAERRPVITDTQGMITQQVVIIPPDVRVRATMLLEGRSVAVLDIEGEPSGRIFKVGDRFAERKGRITRITPERVTIVYEGKAFTFTP
jgi:hypothetical protein